MNQLVVEEVYILYYILPDGHVAVIGAYSTESNAERADPKARSVKTALQAEGVQGPFIGKLTLDDHFMSKDSYLDIKAI